MTRSRSHTRRNPRSNPKGVLRVTSRGYGFVQTAEGEYFVPASKMGGAFDGDIVELAAVSVNHSHKQPHKKYDKTGEKPTARVIRVVEHAHDTIVGRYNIAEPFGIVVPEDKRIPYDIFTMRAESPSVEDGDIVRVRITSYPTKKRAALGVVEDIIGKEEAEGIEVELIIARHKLETAFSAPASAEAERARLDIDESFSEGYRDLRDRKIFTVDPVDARDFDDAVSLEKEDGRWRLGVHIADVSYYVPWGSSIDLDARKRATSVYLVDRVLPMLPHRLSSDLCSLRPHEPRRTMTIDLFLDESFEVKSYDIYPAVIESSARYTYDEVQSIIDGAQDSNELGSRIKMLDAIAKSLMQKRENAGGIDFETKEAKVELDKEGHPLAVVVRERTDATSLIEEAMILANRFVAKHLHSKGFPSLYRVHEAPSHDSLAELSTILREFDYLKSLPMADFVAGNPFVIQQALSLCRDKPEYELISSLVLRAMKRAVYKPECEEHFGLALAEYTHFTSPIRRYPDLVVHRMLKALATGKPETFEQQVHSLPWLAEHSSKMERVAEKAARESQELKLIELMQQSIGETFEAVVSGVTSYGLFVRLENTAEGLIGMRQLGSEYYAFDAKRHTLTGEDSGKAYRLGQRIRVVLDEAHPREGRLDFHPA